MSQPFIGEIRMAGFNFVPIDWAFCNGQLLSISSYEALYNLIGTTYGGDGVQTFALPNLQSRIPLHAGTLAGGSAYVIGEEGGSETVTLSTREIPQHTHNLNATTASGSVTGPSGAVWAASDLDEYSMATPTLTMSANALSNAGSNQPHNNLSPYLTINFIISLFGIYPSQG